MKKRGFTIVELMMVIGIIGVLMGVVTTAASSSVRQARIRRASTLCSLVQSGLATYYAQHDKWPVEPSTMGENSDSDTHELSATEVRQSVLELVKEAKKGNPPMDISGLFVSRSDKEPEPISCQCTGSSHSKYVPAKGAYGLDFMSAIRGTRKSSKKMTTGEMNFGYPHPDNGMFMRFRMVYSIPADSITVEQWHWPSN